jgi:hypothetical protein
MVHMACRSSSLEVQKSRMPEIGTSGLNPTECSGSPHLLGPWGRPARKRWEWPPHKHRFQPVTFSSEKGDFRVRRPAREDLISIWPTVAAIFALWLSILLLSRTVNSGAQRPRRQRNGAAP